MKHAEDDIQRALFAHIKRRACPGVFAFHPANGGKRNISEAVRFKSMGVIPGVPDVILIRGGKVFGLELKSDKPKGRLSVPQISAQIAMREAGAETFTAFGLDEALEQLTAWDLIRADSSITERAMP